MRQASCACKPLPSVSHSVEPVTAFGIGGENRLARRFRRFKQQFSLTAHRAIEAEGRDHGAPVGRADPEVLESIVAALREDHDLGIAVGGVLLDADLGVLEFARLERFGMLGIGRTAAHQRHSKQRYGALDSHIDTPLVHGII